MELKKFYTIAEINNMIKDMNGYRDNLNILRKKMNKAKDGYTISAIEILINKNEKLLLETKYIFDKILESNVTEHKEELLEDLMLFSEGKIKGNKRIYML